jgi:hypothetical protein
MPKRTTLARARQASSEATTQEAVEPALRLAVGTAERERATKQLTYLNRIRRYLDLKVLATNEMWR